MKYVSTRGGTDCVTGSDAILKGICPNGGLFVPEQFPQVSLKDISAMTDMSYPERAAYVMGLYLDEFSHDELLEIANKAYARFDGDPCPVVELDEGFYIMELWHGPTFAFKDMALTVLPQLMSACRKKHGENKKTLVLVATSGDTGKAALEGFKDVDGTEIMVFYPSEGVSAMQKLQMTTTTGKNVYVAGITGNFDDAQTAVKRIFCDDAINAELNAKGYCLSSANSINWGRLLPQIAYYFSAYADVLGSGEIKAGDKIDFCVPCGNFGNILAGYYAKKMGLPVGKLICASNINNILTDFFTSGDYDTDREFHKTISPSMDILVSSNLERLLFEIHGRDGDKVKALMDTLKTEGRYSVNELLMAKLRTEFAAGFATEDETMDTIYNTFEDSGYLLDTHTAVAVSVYNNYLVNSGSETPCVIVSTANPYKFASDVYDAVSDNYVEDAFKAAKKLMVHTGMEIPDGIKNLDTMPIRFTDVLCGEEIKEKVLEKGNK